MRVTFLFFSFADKILKLRLKAHPKDILKSIANSLKSYRKLPYENIFLFEVNNHGEARFPKIFSSINSLFPEGQESIAFNV